MPDPSLGIPPDVANAGGGGVIGALLTLVGGLKLFAKPEDVAKVETNMANLRAEIAEKYMTKEAMEPLTEDIRYIRNRVDQIIDRRQQ